MSTDPTKTDAWQALAAHADKIRDAHLRDLFADDPDRGNRLTATAADLYVDYSQEPGHRRDDRRCSSRWPTARGCPTRIGGDVRRRAHQHQRGPRGPAHRAAAARATRRSWSTARTWSPTCTRCSTGWARSPTGSAPASGRGHTGSAIRTVVNIGIGGSDLGPVMAYEALKAYLDTDIRCRFVSNIDPTDVYEKTARPRPGHDAVRHRVEDVHHAGDADQRDRSAPLAARRAGHRRRQRRRQALRRGLDQRRRVRAFGIDTANMFGFWDWVGGRYSLRLGGRPVADARDRPGALRRDAGRLPRHRRALPHHAAGAQRAGAARPAQRLVQQLLRRPDARGAAVLAVPAPLPGLPAAADDGEQRQVGARRRRRRSTTRPARSSGASRAPTASTPSTS